MAADEVHNEETPALAGVLRSEADGTRTRNHRIDSQSGESGKDCPGRNLRAGEADGAAPRAARPRDRDLEAVIAAWPRLPEPIHAAIMAMLEATVEASS
jgi:hypothetical protein